MVTRKGKNKGRKEKGNKGKYRRGKINGKKRSWENRKGKENLEEGIDLNK